MRSTIRQTVRDTVTKNKRSLTGNVLPIDELIPSANLLHYINPNSAKTYSTGVNISQIVDETGDVFLPQVTSNFMAWDETAFGGYGGCLSRSLSECLRAPNRTLTDGMVFAGAMYIPDTYASHELLSFALGSTISSTDHLVCFGTSGQVGFQRRGIDDAIVYAGKDNDHYRGQYIVYVLEYKSSTEVNVWVNQGGPVQITLEPESSMASRNRYLYGRGVNAIYGDFVVTDASLDDMGITAGQIIASLAKAHNITPVIFPELDNAYVSLNGSYPETWEGIENAGDEIDSEVVASTPLHIIFAAGQSNMTGESDTGQLDINGLDRAHPDVWHTPAAGGVFGSEQPFQFKVYANASVTPAMAFCRYYADNILPEGHKVLLICGAQSGSSLHTDWKKSTGTLYTDMLDYISTALGYNESNILKAILWSQGEADRAESSPESTYITNFTNWMTDVRSDLGDHFPVIIMSCNKNTTQAGIPEIISAQNKLKEGGANGIADVLLQSWDYNKYGDGTKFGVLANNADSVHYDSRAQRIRGVQSAIIFNDWANDLKALYDISDSKTIVQSNGLVFAVNEQLGKDYSLSQSDIDLRPQIGLETLNGINVLTFDGDDDYLQFDFEFQNVLDIANGDNTVFIVYKTNTPAAKQRVVNGFNTGGGTRWGITHNINSNSSLTMVNNSSFTPVDLKVDLDTNYHIAAMVVSGSNLTAMRDSVNYAKTEAKAVPLDINICRVGASSAPAEHLDGSIAQIIIEKRAFTKAELIEQFKILWEKYDIAPVFTSLGGQSNGDDRFTSAIYEFNATSPVNNQYINGTSRGRALLNSNGGTNTWYNWDTRTIEGDAWDKYAASIAHYDVSYVVWDHGESDFIATYFDRYETAIKEVFAEIHARTGADIYVTSPFGTSNSGSAWDGTTPDESAQGIREIYFRVIDEVPYVKKGAERFDLPKSDSQHLTTLGRQLLAERDAYILAGGSAGPEVSNVVRSGTTVTVTITHGDGTDFGPSTGIEGFNFTDDGVEIAITSAVRTNATTITLTLNSAPTGAEVLYYYRGDNGIGVTDEANLVIDNSTGVTGLSKGMPLRAMKWEL